MAYYFIDSSALVKRYVSEIGTAWVRSLTDTSSKNVIIINRITSIEVVAALARRAKSGSLSASDANYAISRFKSELVTHFRITDLTAILANQAISVAQTRQLRGYDALQLATALFVYDELVGVSVPTSPTYVLISADNELNNAATLEGLTVDNPNNHP
jgi:predicted nucleic acid-binding protein